MRLLALAAAAALALACGHYGPPLRAALGATAAAPEVSAGPAECGEPESRP